MSSFIQNFISVFLDSAPWLLFGLFIAGFIKAVMPESLLEKHLGKNNFSAIIKGAFLGAPLPLCSCGVIPVALGIRRSGGSKSATVSFLIATPETGVDSVSITYALLGPFMAVMRPIAAITTAIVAGVGVLRFDNSSEPKKVTEKVSSCCSKKEETSCCSSKQHPVKSAKQAWFERVQAGLKFTFIDLVKDISSWLILGLVAAALIMTFVPESMLKEWGSSSYAYVFMALIGIPMYVCATSSTPIAAGLMFAGVSPGAALVFLLTGPATNISTLAIIRNELGKRTLVIYLITIMSMGMLFGYLTDLLASYFNIVLAHTHVHHHLNSTTLMIISGVILGALLMNGLRLKYFNKY